MVSLLVRLLVLAALVGLIWIEVVHDRRRVARVKLRSRTSPQSRKPTGG
jgi:hypothetical protein